MGEPARKMVTEAPSGREEDPLLRAILAAPMGAPLTAAERAAIADDERTSRRRGLSHDEITKTIERMRAEQGDALEPRVALRG